MKIMIGLTSLALALAVAGPASASITGVSGMMQNPPIPLSLDLNQYQSDTNFFVFDEKKGVTLPANLAVDTLGVAKTYDDPTDLVAGSIGAGTAVNSYIIHADAVIYANLPGGVRPYSGSVTFSNPILGLLVTDARLDGTDTSLGNAPATTYYTGVNRGLEWPGQDSFTIAGKTLTLNLKSAEVLDNIRVLEAVPVPAAIVLGFLGLGLAGWKLRKRY